jgi:AcrR family transcriptional regulator
MPKVVDHDAKRAQLVAAASRVIAQQGLAAATLRTVANAAGCTTGLLTHYFRDRHALLVAALRSAHEAAALRMFQRANAERNPLRRLRAVLHEALPLDDSRLAEWRIWLAFWSEAVNDRALRVENEQRTEEWTALLRLLAAPVSGPSPLVAAELGALIDGLGLQVTLGSVSQREAIKLVDDALRRLRKVRRGQTSV